MANETILVRDLTAQALGHKVHLKRPAQGREKASEAVGTLVSVSHRWFADGPTSTFVVEVLGEEIELEWDGFEEIEFIDELR